MRGTPITHHTFRKETAKAEPYFFKFASAFCRKRAHSLQSQAQFLKSDPLGQRAVHGASKKPQRENPKTGETGRRARPAPRVLPGAAATQMWVSHFCWQSAPTFGGWFARKRPTTDTNRIRWSAPKPKGWDVWLKFEGRIPEAFGQRGLLTSSNLHPLAGVNSLSVSWVFLGTRQNTP